MADLNGSNLGSILVVCTGNICRSPMAEGVLRDRLKDVGMADIRVFSAGTEGWVQAPATPAAVRVCSEIGVDISSHRSAPIDRRHVASADLILTAQLHHQYTIQNRFHPPEGIMALLGLFYPGHPGIEIEDPFNQTDAFYRKVLAQICLSIDGLVKQLTKQMGKKTPG